MAEIQLTNALESLLSETPIYGFEFEGVRHDCGNKLGFLKASVEYALSRSDLGAQFRDYLKSLDLRRVISWPVESVSQWRDPTRSSWRWSRVEGTWDLSEPRDRLAVSGQVNIYSHG